ncbi:MAG: hypothetical protein JW723_01560 [Bacteroidales bacterium]|nr:hypothetical protein [Bacteroidales bacterium]
MTRRITIEVLFLFLIQAYAYSNKLIVTSVYDSKTSPAAGMLRTCIHDAEPGDTILFEVDTVYADTTFFLGDKNIFITGDAENRTKIVGDSSFTIFEVDITDVNRKIEIKNLEISLGYGLTGAIVLQGKYPNKFMMQGCNLVNNYSVYTGAVSLGGGTVSNCCFIDNICVGGEKYKSESAGLFGSYTTIESCVFIDNHNYSESSRYTAGALNVRNSSVTGCRFLNNSAHGTDAGGALYSNFSTISNCYFEDNSVRPDGTGNAGAAVALATDFYNCIFINNKGGDHYIDYSSSGAVSSRGEVSYTNCLFTGNSSKMAGALSLAPDDRHVTNCTFYNNSAEYYGGILLHSVSEGTLNIKNSILYGNVPNNVQCINNSELAFSYTAIEDTLMPGTGNILLHNSPFQSQQAQDSYFLNDTSPCINRGDTTGILAYTGNTDVMGMDRIINDTIDLGAVEFYHRISPLVVWPAARTITYGDPLYKAINSDGTANINGYFSFDSSLVLDAGEHLAEILFSPEKANVYTYKSLTDSTSGHLKPTDF